jgi:hypothetical protein
MSAGKIFNHGEFLIAVERLIRAGADDVAVMNEYPHYTRQRVYAACITVHKKMLGEENGVRFYGPWPVAHIKATGERVFDVGGGHLVHEHSLELLGFHP